MSSVTGPGNRPSIYQASAEIDVQPGKVQSQAKPKSTAKSSKTAKPASTDRSVQAKGSEGASGAKALAQAKEKLISGDSIAKFTTGLRDFGSLAGKLGKGIASADQFLGKLSGILDKTLKGLQDGMQAAEKLGGLENQVKGSFDSLAGVVKSTLQFVDALRGLFGGAAPAPPPAPAAGGPAPAAGGPAPAAGGPAAPAPAAGGPAAPAGAPGQFSLPALDWKPDAHKTDSTTGPSGYNGQADLRTSGGMTTEWREVTEKKTVMETQTVEKVRDKPPTQKTDSAIFYPNDIPKPGTERTVTPENKKYATDFIDKNLEDLKKPGAKLDITGLCSAPASADYNMALGTRRAVNTREAFSQVLKEKGFSQEKIDELLPKESELKSKGKSEAKVGVKDGIQAQGPDRRTDVTLTIPGAKEKYTETVQVPKQIEVKKRVPVEVPKPINVAADHQVAGPGMGISSHVEVRQNPDGTFSIGTGLPKNEFDPKAMMGQFYGGANDPLAALNQQLGSQQQNLGAFAGPVNNLVVGALNGNPSVAPFQAPMQQFGQVVRNNVLARPDMTPTAQKSLESMAGRLDGAANKSYADMQKSVDAYIAQLKSGSSVMGGGPIGMPQY